MLLARPPGAAANEAEAAEPVAGRPSRSLGKNELELERRAAGAFGCLVIPGDLGVWAGEGPEVVGCMISSIAIGAARAGDSTPDSWDPSEANGGDAEVAADAESPGSGAGRSGGPRHRPG